MIKNIIFDIGNVLTDFGWEAFFDSFGFSKEVQKRLADATVKSENWQEYDRGRMSDEEILNSFIQNDPGIEKELRLIFQNVKGMVTKVDYAIPWLKSLKAAGYRVYYLSNFSHIAHVDCIEALDFLSLMDGGILSYQDQLIKPQPEIYELLISRYHLNPEECVFLDDTEKNLPPARALGMATILVENHEQAVRDLGTFLLSTG